MNSPTDDEKIKDWKLIFSAKNSIRLLIEIFWIWKLAYVMVPF